MKTAACVAMCPPGPHGYTDQLTKRLGMEVEGPLEELNDTLWRKTILWILCNIVERVILSRMNVQMVKRTLTFLLGKNH